MNYPKTEPSTDNNILEEPAVAYCPADRTAVAEPWMAGIADEDDELDEFGELSDDDLDWIDNDPEFKASVLRRAEEAIARWKAGEKTYTTDEVCDKLLWRIRNNQWADVEERMRQNGRL
jgi:hypothetical protein